MNTIISYWKEISVLIGAIAAIVALRLNYLRSIKLKKEIELLKKNDNPSNIQIATFKQIEKYGNGKHRRACQYCLGTGRDPMDRGKTCNYCGGIGVDKVEQSEHSGSGCYIATVVYQSEDAPEVEMLRNFRDETMQNSVFGRQLIRFYYGGTGKKVAVLLSTKFKLITPVVKLMLNIFIKIINKDKFT